MKISRAVIGANFGDEGKGLVVDYLCSLGAGCVVRFNGGAQAGHTVVTPSGQRHVFSHFGSGSFLSIPTFLSHFFVCNPILFLREYDALRNIGVSPSIYAHPSCLVTTFADMIINQRIEDARGSNRHGSVGIGFSETIERSGVPELKITLADLWNRSGRVPALISEICEKYAEFRTGERIDEPEMCETFIRACWVFADIVRPAGIAQCADPIFEGAQGLLLDQNNKQFFPHVTRSHTGMKNVRILCEQAKIDKVETFYVSRTYLTRHGAGPLPGENPALRFHDDTNSDHRYQGRIRFAPLDIDGLAKRCAVDNGKPYRAVFTHCDQLETKCKADIYFYGPTRNDLGKRDAA